MMHAAAMIAPLLRDEFPDDHRAAALPLEFIL